MSYFENLLKYDQRYNLRDHVYMQVDQQVRDQMYDLVWYKVDQIVYDQIAKQITNQIGFHVEEQALAETKD